MKVRCCEFHGVCVGPGKNLLPGETADIDPNTAAYLVGIKAVEIVKDDPPPPAPEPESVSIESKPEKSGKSKEK